MTNITTKQFFHPSPNTVIETASSRHTPLNNNKKGNRRPEICGERPNNYEIFLEIDSKEKAIEFMRTNSSNTYTLEVPLVANHIGMSFKYKIKDESVTIIKPTLDKNDPERNAQLLSLIPEPNLSEEVAQIKFYDTKIFFNDMYGNWLMALTRDH